MNILYVVESKLPSKHANSVHAVKIAEALSYYCNKFCMMVIDRYESGTNEEIFSYYAVQSFKLLRIRPNNIIKFTLNNSHQKVYEEYYLALKAYQFAKKEKVDMVITRHPLTAYITTKCKIKTVLDIHDDILEQNCGRAYSMINSKLLRNENILLVTVTKGLKVYMEKKYQLADTITVIPNGCSIEQYSEIGLVNAERITDIGYVGMFHEGKGIKLIDTLARMDVKRTYHLCGGNQELYKNVCGEFPPSNVICYGYVPNRDVPNIIRKCQAVLLPNQHEQKLSEKSDIGEFTSPIKMFEYMASGRILLASDIPVLREILNEEFCYLLNPEDVSEWKDALDAIDSDISIALKKVQMAKSKVINYTWGRRAKALVDLIERFD